MNEGVLLIAHPSAELYGSDRVMLEAIDAVVGAGGTVHVTVPSPGPLVGEIERRGAGVTVGPTPVLRKSALRPRGLLRLAAQCVTGTVTGLRLIRSVRPTVIYVSTLTVPWWIVLGRLSRRPVLVHVHESERQAPLAVRRALATPLLLAQRIVVNSEFSRSVLADSYRSLGRRAQVLYNGVPGPADPVAARAAIEGPARLLFLGRLAPRKGPQVAIQVVGELRDRGVAATLTLVGAVFPGYEWFEAQLRQQIAEAGLDGVVTLAGFTPDVWPALAAADLLLVPSQGDEPFGNTAVEGILAGRPVVVSSGSGLDEAVDGVGGARRVAPADLPGWADAVCELLTNWSTTRAQVRVDSERAAERFSPPAFREQLLRELDAVGFRGAA